MTEYLTSISKTKGSAIINSKLKPIGYILESTSKKTSVTVDGKRTDMRTYTYNLTK